MADAPAKQLCVPPGSAFMPLLQPEASLLPLLHPNVLAFPPAPHTSAEVPAPQAARGFMPPAAAGMLKQESCGLLYGFFAIVSILHPAREERFSASFTSSPYTHANDTRQTLFGFSFEGLGERHPIVECRAGTSPGLP
jgi:hypothetical protein